MYAHSPSCLLVWKLLSSLSLLTHSRLLRQGSVYRCISRYFDERIQFVAAWKKGVTVSWSSAFYETGYVPVHWWRAFATVGAVYFLFLLMIVTAGTSTWRHGSLTAAADNLIGAVQKSLQSESLALLNDWSHAGQQNCKAATGDRCDNGTSVCI